MTMQAYWRTALFAAVAAVLLMSSGGQAGAQQAENPARISDGVVKIGLLVDMSGPYSATTGVGSATAVKMWVNQSTPPVWGPAKKGNG